ncbi:50S ribosomal protein L10 [Candidatus Methanoliparum sp. LAM-1]|uniref:50S ribosomal protein L10 n=1 Tax=Candidatus Methanoliparum sp. LAM-1 TaxID=2874846 RepID=UPI001E41AADE|nr:50S ribosomal protein L10 [Candidatus Methanoliparum sp. LAM-1]BDC36296.1 50S ribosomal protein L10 [Candidatus Methanoliparum sp. LAM-1]
MSIIAKNRGIDWKKSTVDEISTDISKYKTIGIVGMKDVPARQMQEIREKLRRDAFIRMSKNVLIRRALSSQGLERLSDEIKDQTALVFSNKDAFKLFKLLESSKSFAPLKAGELAPTDIIIKKGPTPFKPGPIVGELQRVGIPAAIESGKVIIREDKVILKSGEEVSPKIAEVLNLLKIYPKRLGLDLKVAFEEGETFYKSDLYIDIEKYKTDVINAVNSAYNLAFNTAYPIPEVLPSLIAKAVNDAKNLVFNANIYEPAVIDMLLLKGWRNMLSLASRINEDALDKDLKDKLNIGGVL